MENHGLRFKRHDYIVWFATHREWHTPEFTALAANSRLDETKLQLEELKSDGHLIKNAAGRYRINGEIYGS